MPRWLRRLAGRPDYSEFGAPIPRGWRTLVTIDAVEVRMGDIRNYLGDDTSLTQRINKGARRSSRIFLDPSIREGLINFSAGGRLILLAPVTVLRLRANTLREGIPVFDVGTLQHKGYNVYEIQKAKAVWRMEVWNLATTGPEDEWLRQEGLSLGSNDAAHSLSMRRALSELPSFLMPFYE